MSALRFLLPYLRPYRRQIVFGGICLLLATPCTLFHPLVWKFIVDDVITAKEPHAAWLWAALAVMLVVHLIGTAISCVRGYVLEQVGERFIFDLRNAVYRKLQGQSVGYFHRRRVGDLVQRAMNDVDAVREVVINGIDSIVANLLSFVFVAGIIVALQWVVGLVTLIPLALVWVFIFLFNTRIKALYRRIRDRLGAVSAKLSENLGGMALIKSFARDRHEVERFRAESAGYLADSLVGAKVRAFYMPSVMFVGFLSNIVMIGLGGWFVLNGRFSLGGLIAYRGYWFQLVSPVLTLAQINEMLQRANAATARIKELMDEPEEIRDPAGALTLPRLRGDIRFDHVDFRYADGGAVGAGGVAPETKAERGSAPKMPASGSGGAPLILGGVTFDVRQGQSIGVAGPSGAGKSTLLGLLLRFYDVNAGAVLVDGHDLRTVTQESLRSQFAIVSQEAFLFHDTIAANIGYGRLGATAAEIEAAAKQANAHEFIATLPKGYDTVVGERGVKLSGGQRQRVCIARAFLANPAVLLLDEATAAVEPESEALIQAALKLLMQGRTTVIVSHRLSMVRDCDQILVIKAGQLVERGVHQQLMDLDGWYARMYRLQMEG